MPTIQLRPSSTWQDLGSGPLAVRVLTGAVVLQATDRRPAQDDLSGTVVAASVEAAPLQLAASEWWIKAIVADTVVTLITAAPITAATLAPSGGSGVVTTINGLSGPAVTLDAHDVGTLTAAEIEALVEAGESPPTVVTDAGYA